MRGVNGDVLGRLYRYNPASGQRSLAASGRRAGLVRRLASSPGGVGQGVEAALTWAERARQRRQLAELNDYMLRDIGLSRADVDGRDPQAVLASR